MVLPTALHLGERGEKGKRLLVLRTRLDLREDEDVGVHRLHESFSARP